ITVQHDISTVLEDVRDGVVDSGWEDVWVSCYKEGHTSVHGKLRISKSAGGVTFDVREGIEWSGSSAAEFKVACSSLDIKPTLVRLPKQTYGPPNSQKVSFPTHYGITSG
ncbi:16397_t:CDS:2, partial [Acaulospora colombiana]